LWLNGTYIGIRAKQDVIALRELDIAICHPVIVIFYIINYYSVIYVRLCQYDPGSNNNHIDTLEI
jgi:hypothetical protein